MIEKHSAQDLNGLNSQIKWDEVVLRNYAIFKNRNELNYGGAFLIRYNNEVIACTARDFTGTIYTHFKMLLIKDFKNELVSWKMFLPFNRSNFVLVDSLTLKERIEKKMFIFMFSRSFLCFALKNINNKITPLEPNITRNKNKDTVFVVGYDDNNNLKIVRGFINTGDMEKYADFELRIQTEEYLYDNNFVGSPIVDKDGKAIGVVNRAYCLKFSKNGNIIDPEKNPLGSHYDFFVNGVPMRSMLGESYGKNNVKSIPKQKTQR